MTKTSPVVANHIALDEPLKRAPTLYVIIIFKLIKGILAAGLAVGLFFQSSEKISQDWKQFLEYPAVVKTFHYLRIHPENNFFTKVGEKLNDLTDAGVRGAALGALLWSLFPTVEGLGLLFRASWAGWLAILESAFFVPVEVYRLLEDFSWFMTIVTVTNIAIVWYLYANRERLFHHHIHGVKKPIDV